MSLNLDDLPRNLAKKIRVTGDGQCWVWTGSERYAQVAGKRTNVRRYLWELVNGPITPGFVVSGMCANPKTCCKPYHMKTSTFGTAHGRPRGRSIPPGNPDPSWWTK